MTRTYCPRCESHVAEIHTCYNAAALRAHRAAERAVLEAVRLLGVDEDDTMQQLRTGVSIAVKMRLRALAEAHHTLTQLESA